MAVCILDKTIEQPDEELIRRFQSGEDEAFNLILERHQEMVLRVCRHLLRSQADAKDAGQEIFIKIYQNLKSFQPQARFSTWLYRITLNHCFNVLRSRKRKRWLSPFAGSKEQSKVREKADPAGNPLQNLEQNERIEHVRHALAALPSDQHVAIVLHRYEGLSYQEIAEVTRSSVSAVESRLHRAKKNLHRALSDYIKE
jgi:RNA polymerase sigma-70 factor, ECF subfamily